MDEGKKKEDRKVKVEAEEGEGGWVKEKKMKEDGKKEAAR